MSMNAGQVIESLKIIGGKENLYLVLINNGKRITITEEKDLDNLEFHHDKELLVLKETLAGEVKLKSTIPYAIVESLVGFDGEYTDPMVVDNQWRIMRKKNTKCIDGTMEEALKEREKEKNMNSCENLDPDRPNYIS